MGYEHGLDPRSSVRDQKAIVRSRRPNGIRRGRRGFLAFICRLLRPVCVGNTVHPALPNTAKMRMASARIGDYNAIHLPLFFPVQFMQVGRLFQQSAFRWGLYFTFWTFL